jgi:[ribosomal protein S5]-alanine N-acetyltransferase
MISELQTKRLLLKPLELADAEQTQRLFPHWEIVRYLSHVVPWPYPADGAYRYYENVALAAMQRGEQWHWTLRLKTAPENLIGSISLLQGVNQNRGFWLGLSLARSGSDERSGGSRNRVLVQCLGIQGAACAEGHRQRSISPNIREKRNARDRHRRT